MNHALLADFDLPLAVREETHIERLRRIAAQADERRGVDITNLSPAERIRLARGK